MTNKYEDLSLVSADRVDELGSALADIAVRRAAIEALANAAREKIAEANQSRLTLVAALASGKHDAPGMSAAVAARADAEALLAAYSESLTELEAEHAATVKFSERCQRLKGQAHKAELVKLAESKAVDLDAAGAAFNAAFQIWRDAKRSAHDFIPPFSGEHGYGGPAFRAAGAGWEASASLHPEIKLALARLDYVNTAAGVATR
jgi:hypothetical protein